MCRYQQRQGLWDNSASSVTSKLPNRNLLEAWSLYLKELVKGAQNFRAIDNVLMK
jgi:hypothetical protein